MNWPDFTKRSNAIVILLFLDLFFFGSMFFAFAKSSFPPELRSVCKDAFTGIAGALLLALKLGGPETPTVDADTGGTVQQITTVTAPPTSPTVPPTPEVKP
jgi:hypothetical protein